MLSSRLHSIAFALQYKHYANICCEFMPNNWIQFTIVLFFFYSNIQRQDGHMQRFIREVNTTSRSCVLWDLEEDTNYIIQVQSIGLYGESQASKKVHFHTLKKSDRFPSNSSNQGMAL